MPQCVHHEKRCIRGLCLCGGRQPSRPVRLVWASCFAVQAPSTRGWVHVACVSCSRAVLPVESSFIHKNQQDFVFMLLVAFATHRTGQFSHAAYIYVCPQQYRANSSGVGCDLWCLWLCVLEIVEDAWIRSLALPAALNYVRYQQPISPRSCWHRLFRPLFPMTGASAPFHIPYSVPVHCARHYLQNKFEGVRLVLLHRPCCPPLPTSPRRRCRTPPQPTAADAAAHRRCRSAPPVLATAAYRSRRRSPPQLCGVQSWRVPPAWP